jgi:hypothetical protein
MSAPQPPAPVPFEAVERLGAYVYLLRDPRTGEPFYVGKGRGSRVHHHVWAVMGEAQRIESTEAAADTPETSATTTAKNGRIRSILDAGFLPEHWIVRHGIEAGEGAEQAAFAVEQALIAGLGLANIEPLSNIMGGHLSTGEGVHLAEELILRYGAPLAPQVPRPCALLLVKRAAIPGADIYKEARCCWRAGLHMRSIQSLPIIVFANDVVREVYRAKRWTLVSELGASDKLWRWQGRVDLELRELYVGTSLREVRWARSDGKWRQHGWHPYK